MKKDKTFFLGLMAFGIMALNNTATAYAEWSPNGQSDAMSGYSGQIMLGSADRHNLSDFKRIDNSGSGDGLFGSNSVQAPVTLVAGAAIEISIMTAGEEVSDKHVNGKPCPTNKSFNAFVTPVATCSSHFGSNFSGFRAQAVNNPNGSWSPMLYMNVKGRWINLGEGGSAVPNTPTAGSGLSGGELTTKKQCAQVLVQKICQ